MDLPITENGNKHVIVVQDLFTKWPFVFAVPDQKAPRITRIVAEQVVPLFGVPEALLSDRGIYESTVTFCAGHMSTPRCYKAEYQCLSPAV